MEFDTNLPSCLELQGYSTPAITRGADGLYHLTHDVVFNPLGFEQMAISYARSEDGINFEEVSTNIVVVDDAPWLTDQVLAPFLVMEEESLALWFAGGQELITFDNWEYGIGRVNGSYDCGP